MSMFTFPGDPLWGSLRREKLALPLARITSQEFSGKNGKWKCLLSNDSLCVVIHSSARNSYEGMISFWWIFQFSLYGLVSKHQVSKATCCRTPMGCLTAAGALPARKGDLWETQRSWTMDSVRGCECGGFHKNIYLKILSNNASPKAYERQWNIFHRSS